MKQPLLGSAVWWSGPGTMSRLAAGLILSAAAGWGCMCGGSPLGLQPCQYARSYSAVITGVVTQVDNPGPPVYRPGEPAPTFTVGNYPKQKVTFKITRVLNGLNESPSEIVVQTGIGGGDCGYRFERGLEYIVYAQQQPGSALATDICTPTRPVNQASEDLEYFANIAQRPANGDIRIVTFDDRTALAGARVTLRNGELSQSIETNAWGTALFASMPPGEYQIEVAREGYRSPDHLPPVRLQAKGCAAIPIWMSIERRITGRATDRQRRPDRH